MIRFISAMLNVLLMVEGRHFWTQTTTRKEKRRMQMKNWKLTPRNQALASWFCPLLCFEGVQMQNELPNLSVL